MIENVILEQLNTHLELIHALPESQSAYRNLHSTETELCSVVNDMRMLMDEGKCGVLILLGLRAAFDTVVHSILLQDCRNIVYLKELLSDFSAAFDLTLRYNVQLDRLNKPRFNIEMGRKAFVNSAPMLYNKLPECVRISENYIIFKKKLKAYLFTKCYNTGSMSMRADLGY
ncbi:uncharacterized protein LOC143018553 [Oratosquilla oratoria]|uniref:uncharacterized protein LOC143018553 n=1 Tax=Oratosquilla oratoria TaxID=337810 RepID=UPI003F76CFD9